MSTDSRRNRKNLMLDRIQREWTEKEIDAITWNRNNNRSNFGTAAERAICAAAGDCCIYNHTRDLSIH